MSLAADLRRSLADAIGSAAWHTALLAVPRELFLGEAVYRHGDLGWTPVRRAGMSAEDWLRLVYTDETWVTQINGVMAEDATEPIWVLRPTSSSTLPGLVVRMMETAQISEGDKVLEIGTGTGYSTALLCHRLGDQAVTSIEYDPLVAALADQALGEAGYSPMLVAGDGLEGYAGNAPYDRLIATCAVRAVPSMWLDQVRAGGTITTPMLGWTGGVACAHLHVTEHGSASGRFVEDDVYFMMARPHIPPPRPTMSMGIGVVSESRIDPSLLKDDTALFVAQLAVPQAQHGWAGEILTLLDVSTGAQADVRSNPAGGWMVHQHGPVKLWDRVEETVLTWLGAGRPHQSGFGLTVTRDSQYVWLGEPDGPSWNLPA